MFDWEELLPISILICVLVFTAVVCMSIVNREPDSTDSSAGPSGMRLHVDDLTGCHYLSIEFGGLIPRLDKNGDHVCIGHLPTDLNAAEERREKFQTAFNALVGAINE